MVKPLSYPAAVAATLALLVGSGAALYRCSRLPAGHPLLGAVAAACIAINFAAPLLLFDANTCHSTRGMTTFAISWIASSKALALFCGRGQLAARRWRLPQFLALYIMPLLADTSAPPPGGAPRAKTPGASAAVAPAADGSGSSDGGGSLARRTAVNAAITALCLLGAVSGPPLIVKQALLSLAMYGWLGEYWGSAGVCRRGWRCLFGVGSKAARRSVLHWLILLNIWSCFGAPGRHLNCRLQPLAGGPPVQLVSRQYSSTPQAATVLLCTHCALHLAAGFQLGLLEAVALPWLGLRLQPLFRPPWTEARSLAAFWGR